MGDGDTPATAAKPLPTYANFASFMQHTISSELFVYMRKVLNIHGPIVRNNMLGKFEHHVSDPASIKTIFSSPSFVRTDYLIANVTDIVQYALFGMPTGETWKNHRKAIQSGLGMQFVRKAYTQVESAAATLISAWNSRLDDPSQQHITVNLSDYLSALTLDVISEAAFSYDSSVISTLHADDIRGSRRSSLTDKNSLRWNVDRLMNAVILRMFLPKWMFGLFGVSRKQMTGVSEFFSKIVDRCLAERLNKLQSEDASAEDIEDDLLKILLSTDEDGNRKFSNKEVRDECLALYIAGHETTSTSLTNLFLCLCQNPRVIAKLRDEIDSLTADSEQLTVEDLKKFKYLENVIHESMRFYPLFMGIDRVCQEDVQLLGYTFKKGTYFSCVTQQAFLDAQYWGDNVHEFEPERFDRPVVPGAFLPFGLGPHMCPGMRMALMEMKVVVIRLLQHFDFRLAGAHSPKFVDGITIHLEGGLHVVVSKRAG
ncbi:Cytochrome P450 3A4 [Entophlyctis luteolus]|nr:Cytochrome P450 3A4 [Entophlyctis luteolus]